MAKGGRYPNSQKRTPQPSASSNRSVSWMWKERSSVQIAGICGFIRCLEHTKYHLVPDTNCQEGKERPLCGFPRSYQYLWVDASRDFMDSFQLQGPREHYKASQSLPPGSPVLHHNTGHHHHSTLRLDYNGELYHFSPIIHHGNGAHALTIVGGWSEGNTWMGCVFLQSGCTWMTWPQ